MVRYVFFSPLRKQSHSQMRCLGTDTCYQPDPAHFYQVPFEGLDETITYILYAREENPCVPLSLRGILTHFKILPSPKRMSKKQLKPLDKTLPAGPLIQLCRQRAPSYACE